MTSKQLMDLAEAIITGLSPRPIHLDCASGRLPAYQSAVGTPNLIHYTHLTRYMEVNNAA